MLQNWDSLQMQFGDYTYELVLGYSGEEIGVNVFTRVSQ